MSKWIEIEITDFDITQYFKQVGDEFEWYIDKLKTTLYIYKNTKAWMKCVFEILVKQSIPFVFIPCDYERYCKDITYKDSYETFDYKAYCNLNNLIHQQFEVEISANEENTNYWHNEFNYPLESLKEKIHTHIRLAKPKKKYLNLAKLEQWEDKTPFTFNPWDSKTRDILDVDIAFDPWNGDKQGSLDQSDKYLCQLNTKHEDYANAQNVINELEMIDYDISKSLSAFKKYDTKNSQDNRILCFMIDILNSKTTHANNFIENDVRIHLKEALDSIKVILNNGHPSELLNLTAIIRSVLQQPDYEKMLSGLDNMFSQDNKTQLNAIVKLGKLYSGKYDKEIIQSEILDEYLDFYKKAIFYFKNSGLVDEEFNEKT